MNQKIFHNQWNMIRIMLAHNFLSPPPLPCRDGGRALAARAYIKRIILLLYKTNLIFIRATRCGVSLSCGGHVFDYKQQQQQNHSQIIEINFIFLLADMYAMLRIFSPHTNCKGVSISVCVYRIYTIRCCWWWWYMVVGANKSPFYAIIDAASLWFSFLE